MEPRLTWESVKAMVAQRRRKTDSAQSPSLEPSREPAAKPAPEAAAITVRFATPDDARDLECLAALDSGSVPTGPALVAEVDGQLAAALPLRRGRALADPFRATAGLIRLLELREAQLRGRDRRGRRASGLRRLASGRAAPAETRP
jgi:hypothetical protein